MTLGEYGEWRISTCSNRIIYEIDYGMLIVLVLAVNHRRELLRRS
ncbi:type II toxin-antitoxin system RelE/ParE family toxin [Actinomyces sp. ZJ308]|nr:type II toxin-antitoxin system RelE/ParE family toxin [Actinomyces sp. ZJ308]